MKLEKMNQLWNYFDELVKEQNSASTPAVEAVVDAYLHEPVCGRKSNPLDYWKQKQSLWPVLATMACKDLSIPPSSVLSERRSVLQVTLSVTKGTDSLLKK